MTVSRARSPVFKPKRWFRLGAKILLSFLAVTLIPLISISVLNNRDIQRALTDNASRALLSVATQSAAALDTFIESNLRAVQSESQFPGFVELLDTPPDKRSAEQITRIAQVLESLQSKDSVYITSYALFDADGRDILDTYTPDLGLLKADREYFVEALKGLPYVSSVYFSRTLGGTSALSIYFSAPVRNAQGEIVGVLRIRYNAEILQEILSRRVGQRDPTEFAILLDENYIRLADTAHPELVLKSLVPLSVDQAVRLQGLRRLPPGSVQELTTNQVEVVRALEQLDADQPYLTAEISAPGAGLEQAAVASLSRTPWKLVVGQSRASFLRAVYAQRQRNLILLTVVALAVSGSAALLTRTLVRPISRLTTIAQQVSEGNFSVQAEVRSGDEIGLLAHAFNDMTGQVRELIGSLEERVAQRTAELERRSRYLQASSEVGRIAVSTLEAERLADLVTEAILEQFGFYYTALFTLDETGHYAMLRAGTGEIGRVLLAQEYKVPLSSSSVVGRCIAQGRAYTGQVEPGEMGLVGLEVSGLYQAVLPLRVRGGLVIGALLFWSRRADDFDPASLVVLQLMADQVAAGWENARLFAQTQEAMESTRRAYGELSLQGWLNLVRSQPSLSYLSNKYGILRVEELDSPEIIHALQSGQTVQVIKSADGSEQGEPVIAVPIKVSGNVIGALGARKVAGEAGWQSSETVLLEALAEQLGLAMESARLYQESQRAATRERLTREITDRLRRAMTVQELLQFTAQELSVLGTAETFVQLLPEMPAEKEQTNRMEV